MKRIIFISLSAAVVLSLASFIFVKNEMSNNNSSELLFSTNIEALAGSGELPDGWLQGRKMGQIAIKSSASAGGEIGTGGGSGKGEITWVYIDCCVGSDPGNACDGNSENSRCRNHS